MSVNLMSAIFQAEFFDLKDENGNVTKASTAKLVLLAMADHANDEGEGIYPSVETLCRKTALSPQTIRNTFDALRHNGIIFLNGRSKFGTNNHAINTACFPRAIGKEVVYLTLQPLGGLTGNSDPSNQSFLPPHRLDPNHTLTIPEPSTDAVFSEPTPTKKQGDLVDGLLSLSQAPGIKRQARIDAILSVLAERLHVRTTGRRWEDFAKLVDDRQQNFGEKLDVFLEWLVGQKGFNPQYWPPARMAEFWPQAFTAPTTKPIEYYTPPKDEGEYISKEEAKRRGLAK